MRRPGYLSGPGLWVLLLFLVGLLAGLSPGLAETLKVERANTQLYESPHFGSISLYPVPRALRWRLCPAPEIGSR